MAYIGKFLLENSTTRQPNPLEIAHRGRVPTHQGYAIIEREVPRLLRLRPAARILHGGPSPTSLSPTINERGVLRPSKLRPAAHISQRGRYPNPRSPSIIERGNPGPSRLQPGAHDTTPAVAQQEPDQHPSTQGVDFSQDPTEPKNPFTRQYIDRLEAEIKQSEARVAKEQRILQKYLRHREEADKHHHGPCPSEWPSEPTLPHFDIGKKGSRKQKGAVPRSTRAGVDTHARHNERASGLETVSLQRRMLDGLMLTLNHGGNGIFNTLSNGVRYLIRG